MPGCTANGRAITPLLLCSALLLSACGGGDGGSSPPPPTPQPGSLQFNASTFQVDEDSGTATLTITRTGGSDGAVSVTVASSNGSAVAGQDYTALSTTVNFATGDAVAKTVTVPIMNDSIGEPTETVSVALSAATGGATLGTNTTATLTIRDDDLLALTVQPGIKQLIFSWSKFADTTAYRLMRDPDGASGFTQVGPDHATTETGTTLAVGVHKLDWMKAQYRVDACNAQAVCTPSAPITALSAMINAIGYFKASNSEASDNFGAEIAISADGSTLAVSAPLEDGDGMGSDQSNNGAQSAGAVYIFTHDATHWSQQAYLKASNAEAGDRFGTSLALNEDGSTLVVSAPFEDSNSKGIDQPQGNDTDRPLDFDAGAVYVFTRNGTQWSQQAYIKASNTDAEDLFGTSLALSTDGNTLAVSATGEDSAANEVDGPQGNDNLPGQFDGGAVYVFTRAGATWSQQAYVKPSNMDHFDLFGASLALSADGNTLVVGAPSEDSSSQNVDGDPGNAIDPDGVNFNAGAAYVFTHDQMGWSQQAYLKASNTHKTDQFGTKVAISADGNTIAVGAPNENGAATGVGGNQQDLTSFIAGAVYVFARADANAPWSPQAYVKAFNTSVRDEFGRALALNGDGTLLAVGSRFESNNASGVRTEAVDLPTLDTSGAVYLYSRAQAQWSKFRYVKASNADDGDLFGAALALSEDGNTLAVGAIAEDSGMDGIGGNQGDESTLSAGAVYVY